MSNLLRVRLRLQTIQYVVYWVIDQEQWTLFIYIQLRRGLRFLECSFNILHEFIEVERNANGLLQLFKFILLEKKVMSLLAWHLIRVCYRQWPYNVNHETSREVTTDQAEHLMIVQSCYHFVIRSWMKHLLNLLQKAFPIQSSCTHKCIFSK